MSKPIFELVDELPTSGLTVSLLNALDFVAPGEWQNTVGFVNTIKTVTGETDEDLIQAIGERAVYLFNDKSQGYQTALWLYQTVDGTDKALGAAALANKVGETIPLLGFLNSITPKPDKAQTIDLTLKIVVELVAFCQINGIPGDSIGDFVAALGEYAGESLIRMVALICVDGILPLGPDFVQKSLAFLSSMNPQELDQNSTFKSIKDAIPGNGIGGKIDFIGQSLDSVEGWMNGIVSANALTAQKVLNNISGFLDFADDKLDYVAAFLDVSTNYYEHTGTQTLARRLIERAVAEI
ncbi:hypothetical protein CEP10_12575 [Cylindrospermopsis raciborskii S07]|uniref:Uncharacterized protein n=2 Tax=Cylindrospermopsis raciborskii TaxID=77022 RepID=A0A853MKA8_9CYAN|nr:hypothetical protein [Cylindrospermopsis raciborskii]OBU77656.1 hypothetical protein A9P98_16245 [Cylindrospermopsis raciborskii CS-505]OHY35601.1 hypothetical protein BCV63_15755 [Cylindrospermopsis raciborskii CS-508]PNJ93390.1 hypothetical protein CEP15_14690 [Cylindrospermopsis raciborskii C07]PNJ94805.1 hypothetical protein CEP13_10210 [Cylindrospermopsis raciborskii C03]PNJ94901.1 hypothetical protein CEP14_10175 [Cylindrospermopsis raciborskii C04]